MLHHHDLPSAGFTFGDKYTVLRLLGEGGMGAVFEVEHTFTKKRFALKWMPPAVAQNEEAIERFAQEARISCAIDHPNIVDVFDVCFVDGAMFLVMELLRGESLAERIERAGAMDPAECVSLLLPILHGLHEAHAQGIIHRDLKPDNVFLAQARPQLPIVANLLDFGISKIQQGDAAMRLTASGMMMGTAHYMAPEQTRDAASVGVAADIYSFGAMLYEALSGRLPFTSENFGTLVSQIVLDAPPDICAHAPNVPRALGDVVMRTLAKDPEKRLPDAETLAKELSSALALPPALFGPSTVGWVPTRPAIGDPNRNSDESPNGALEAVAPSRRRLGTRCLAGLILAFATAVAVVANLPC